jgi:Family of unknown function (DUF5675)
MKMIINRYQSSDKQTLGEMTVMDDSGDEVFSCKTLELPWKDNQSNVSCIPTATYTVKSRYSDRFKNHFHIQDVPNRTWILIHPGNYYTQIQGCVLVGEGFADINKDGYMDVVSSKHTMSKLLELMPDEYELVIQDK